jgi:phenylpyruvate tautomerase PptA (4-oxalocrotonate tautomerase family)
MAQIKVYGLKSSLAKNRKALSLAIHSAVMEALSYPEEKKFHRFMPLEKDDFVYPVDRSENYTIIEISMFEGRSVAAKKQLINLIFENVDHKVGIKPQDVEITIFETPKHNWGIRGKPGDELSLNYQVDV